MWPTGLAPSSRRGGRYMTAVLMVAVGVSLSLATWFRALQERRMEMTNVLQSLADHTSTAIDWQMRQEVDALRSLSAFWQTHEPVDPDAWQFDARMILEHFPGIQWIAWVPGSSQAPRVAASDPLTRIPTDLPERAHANLGAPAGTIDDRWDDGYQMEVYLPVRMPGDSLGILVGHVRVDSLWMRGVPAPAEQLVVGLTGPDGQRIFLQGGPDIPQGPPWARMDRSLVTPAGARLTLSVWPSGAYLQQVMTPWPNYFFATGALVSIAIAVLLLQFLRLREVSAALGRSNRALDSRVAELSRRDLELRELNEALEQRVQSRTAELTEALREVEIFSHSLSHDLRSPVGAILNFAAVLEEDYGTALNEEGRRLVRRILATGGRANQLLDSLSDFVTSGAGPQTVRTLDMRELAEHAYAEAAARDGHGGDVDFTVGPLPPAQGDPDQVHRIFVNLLGNALKYSQGRDRRRVVVGGAAESPESIYWVQDNGRGFESSRAAEIFGPFRRLHESDIEGAGLGLAIVARLVRGLGGRVWAESDGRSGATIFFTLPSAERVG